MKNSIILVFGSVLLFLISCKKEVEPPKLIYEDAKNNASKTIITDTSRIKIADLPIQIIGTKFLIFPIGDYRIYEGKSRSGYGSTSDLGSFTISNHNEFEITGFLSNIKFQSIDSDSIFALSNKPVLIQTATYLKTISDKTKKQFMVYTLSDMDTNRDGKLDSDDIKSLYVSEISGKRFTKISTKFEELIDWNLIESKNRLYFRTIEDTNKNGKFDKNDPVHYNFIDLLSNDWKIQSYKPI